VLDALSSTFPDGEAFFVRSVHHYRDLVDDAELAEAIRCFSGQEGQHRRVHADHVQLLVDQGYTALVPMNRLLDRVMRWFNRRMPATALAITASVEHLTALLARKVLAHDAALVAPMHPEMAALWRWHALEEAEHKAVAFDVMDRYGPGHAHRAFAQLLSTTLLVLEVLVRLLYMLSKDRLLLDAGTWKDGLRFLFGSGGLLRGGAGHYFAWYQRGFHPDDIDDAALVGETRPIVEAALLR
jgi:predicted metal-dependent hydrolase